MKKRWARGNRPQRFSLGELIATPHTCSRRDRWYGPQRVQKGGQATALRKALHTNLDEHTVLVTEGGQVVLQRRQLLLPEPVKRAKT